ncbi:hypothetical protein BH18ACI4_BH18ACI4_04740 [soil metagenome]
MMMFSFLFFDAAAEAKPAAILITECWLPELATLKFVFT